MMLGTVGRVLTVPILLAVGSVAAAAEPTIPERCPGYVGHLRNARAYLVQGNRKAAASELRQAQRAIDACSRGKADEGSALAHAGWARARSASG